MAQRELSVCVVGAELSGKSTFTHWLMENRFVPQLDSVFEDYYNQTLEMNGITVKVSLVDTSGLAELQAEVACQIDRGKFQAFFLVFSTSVPNPMDVVKQYHRLMVDNTANGKPCVVLVGTRSDDTRTTSRADAEAVAASMDAVYCEVTLATGEGVRAAGDLLVSRRILASTSHTIADWFVKSGGGVLKGNQRRWFSLTGRTLRYYESKEAERDKKKPKGELDLTGGSVSIDWTTSSLELDGPHLNQKKQGKGYTIVPPAQQLNYWHKVINAAIADQWADPTLATV
eukprot:NODE_2899_length_973_cov_61.806147_g2879_i0.p1 GENE.NODE_2899_length_973_cov_61.806147_g2879_i0~~NODE_2899_length_973_cov_61.806147_g2879_i0.p1  ORF type:complete len:317 (-),score=40.66 NODE_2899_length_973_cov_61.806147_g2879_i0:23-880(-)